MVPFAKAIRLAGRLFLVGRQVIEPAATSFVVDAAGITPLGIMVDLDLVAMHTPGSHFSLPWLAVRFGSGGVVLLVTHLGTNHDARVETNVVIDFQFEHEVAVRFWRAEETIRRIGHRRADDRPIHHFVFGFPAPLDPAIERLAVEQRYKFSAAYGTAKKGYASRQSNNSQHKTASQARLH